MRAPAKIVCLESYWNEQMFQDISVKPFLDGMAPLVHPPLTVAHRFVDSSAALAYYLRRPGGVMWRQKELFDAPVYYLAFHGRAASVRAVVDRISGDELMEAFDGYGGGGYRNLVYFAACNVFRGQRGITFARQFLKKTGVQAVVGYATPVGWMASLVCDLLFLHRFYTDPSPWKNLKKIFNSVHRDYPAARRLKHIMITQGDLR
ncbi:MAG TPA: hypothetical protein VM183_20520 [Burkholderiales bacterium]|nr:hypothetical protein [Burkholderiales bacterium]